MSLKQIYNVILCRHLRLQNVFAKRLFATGSTESKTEVDITTADEEPIYSTMDDPQIQAEIAKKQNKSRLSPAHRNMLMDVRPYDSPKNWHHNTVKYKKRMLGRYGLKAVNEPAGFAWPTLKEVKDAQEYERVAYPLSLQDNWKELEKEKKAKAQAKEMRENYIAEKLGKMEKWTAELHERITKKEAALEAAKLRKTRMVEEIRSHFGFKISPHDDRFKEMLVQKEKEEKKKKKEAKKQAKMERLQNYVENLKKASEEATESTKPNE